MLVQKNRLSDRDKESQQESIEILLLSKPDIYCSLWRVKTGIPDGKNTEA